MPNAMLKTLFRAEDEKKNDGLVKLIKSGLKDLKEEIENMFENEMEIEESYKMVGIVERILEFNIQEQEGQGLKILTPDLNA